MKTDIEKLALAFSKELVHDLSSCDMLNVQQRNAHETNESICHSHDFCDANMVMLHAWNKVFPNRRMKLNSDKDIELWNAAWALAKSKNFYFPIVRAFTHDEHLLCGSEPHTTVVDESEGGTR